MRGEMNKFIFEDIVDYILSTKNIITEDAAADREKEVWNHDPLYPTASIESAEDKFAVALIILQKASPLYFRMQTSSMNVVYNHPDIKSAAVDKNGNFYMNTDFINKITEKELVGLIVHEISHLAMDDLFRVGNRNPKLWNIATDLVNNWCIHNDGFSLPPGVLLPDLADGLLKEVDGFPIPPELHIDLNKTTSEEVYEAIKNFRNDLIQKMADKAIDVHITATDIQDIQTGDRGDGVRFPGGAPQPKQPENLVGSTVFDKNTGEEGIVVSDDNNGNIVVIPIMRDEVDQITANVFFNKRGKI
jgi:hypothetical protein